MNRPPSCDPQAAADLLRALAHPMRLQILCRLLDGEVAVAGFETELGLKQPNLSQQLGQLREANLVATRREAKSIFYRLADDRIQIILDALRTCFAGDTAGPVPAPRDPAPRDPRPRDPGPRDPGPPRALPRPVAATPTAPAPHVIKAVASECGVFSSAGWPVQQDTKRTVHG